MTNPRMSVHGTSATAGSILAMLAMESLLNKVSTHAWDI